ncbi:zinc finger protein RFP-like [Alligator mississippiensis]|uniref:zinc finger protein RFP-like n=1 Tax=Alligator mississippiensis TaxID=8496 RepID=UPI0003D0883C|nr:zinc finger protein RFP-like [Alligator mississippiensis]XP_019351147.1 zinc finger protein RFP-like [Alligator mississippiensis]XP_059570990.1 zinc finger protein RFP-like [Alligator mississippiensis]
MAAETLAANLQDELSCSICLDLFKDPVSIHCGHNFCRACIVQCWEGSDTIFFCPQCREAAPKTNFRPNRELARVAEIAKQLSSQPAKGAGGGEALCTKHGEPLKLFCEEDQAPICVVCDRSKTHRAHNVVPIEEAAQEYMEQVQDRLQTLKEEREKLLRIQASTEGKFWRYLEKIETQKKRIASKFEAFHKFLQEQEQFLLAQLTELDKELQKLQKENVTKLSKEISHLNNLIKEVEQKCQHPASEFLQDIRNTLSRCEKGKIQQPVEVSPEFERRLQKLSQREVVGNKALRIMQDVLMNKQQKAVKVTLNPDTAHSHLVISEDRKNVRWAVARHHLPDTPQRFDSVPCVLGHEGFATGRHYWEVEVGAGSIWALGVARESLRRKGWISLNPDDGIWAVQRSLDQLRALTAPDSTLLSLRCIPKRIRVYLNSEEGQVAFFDADTKAWIFSFPPASFTGERMLPWFWVGGSWLRLHP